MPPHERFCPTHARSVWPRLRQRLRKPRFPAAGINHAMARVPNADAARGKPQRPPLPVQRFWFLLARCEKELARKRVARGEIEVDLALKEKPHRIPRGETAVDFEFLDSRSSIDVKSLRSPGRSKSKNQKRFRSKSPSLGQIPNRVQADEIKPPSPAQICASPPAKDR